MRKWESKKPHQHGVWVSEVRIKNVSNTKLGKINKLLKLLKEDFNEDLSGN